MRIPEFINFKTVIKNRIIPHNHAALNLEVWSAAVNMMKYVIILSNTFVYKIDTVIVVSFLFAYHYLLRYYINIITQTEKRHDADSFHNYVMFSVYIYIHLTII